MNLPGTNTLQNSTRGIEHEIEEHVYTVTYCTLFFYTEKFNSI